MNQIIQCNIPGMHTFVFCVMLLCHVIMKIVVDRSQRADDDDDFVVIESCVWGIK